VDIEQVRKERADMEKTILDAIYVFHAKTGLYPASINVDIMPIIEYNERTRYIINGFTTKIYL